MAGGHTPDMLTLLLIVVILLLLFGGLVMYSSFLFIGPDGYAQLPNAGWTSYPPLATLMFDPGRNIDFWILGLFVTGIGTIATGLNLVVTVILLRAPGMTSPMPHVLVPKS